MECFHHLIGWQYHLQRYLWEGCGNTFQQFGQSLHALKVQPHLSSHQFPVPLTFVAWQPKNKHLKGRTGTRTLMKTTESATPTKCGYSHLHFDVCLQTTLVIKYLEKQHDNEIGTTVVKLWLKNRKAKQKFHHEKNQQDVAYANEPHRPLRQRCKTCALTCSFDLFLRSPRDVKVICFSIWITHNKDVMHSPQLFSLLILRWILLLSVFSLSLTLWFSPVLCMSFPYTPVLLSNRDTHAHTEQTASLTCADCNMQTACWTGQSDERKRRWI